MLQCDSMCLRQSFLALVFWAQLDAFQSPSWVPLPLLSDIEVVQAQQLQQNFDVFCNHLRFLVADWRVVDRSVF